MWINVFSQSLSAKIESVVLNKEFKEEKKIWFSNFMAFGKQITSIKT